jgi:peptidoglycan/xylan/chitin deacetylase (PgdA/CDA1 family)
MILTCATHTEEKSIVDQMKVIIAILLAAGFVQAQTIAVTIDDLPVVTTQRELAARRDITKRLLGHIRGAKVPAVGFVNENKLYRNEQRAEDEIALLKMWLDAGLELGNHTYSHRSLNRIPIEEYKADLLKGEAITKELLRSKGRGMRYFRHPFLQTGRSMEIKADFHAFLKEHGYTIAPITFDNGDYIFARAYDNARDKNDRDLMKRVGEAYVPYMEAKMAYWEQQSQKLLGRNMSHTLLLHANSINAEYFDDLAAMLKKRGYKFVTLEEALRDEAYSLPDTYIGPAGISWLHRWAREKGREFIVTDEPKVPEFVLKASGFESE